MKKVLIVAPVHSWDDVRVFKKQAISLSEAGFDVTLIARTSKTSKIKNITIIKPKGCHTNRFLRFLSIPIVSVQALLFNADIYHLHNPDTIPIAWLLKLFRKKVIYDTHEDFTQRVLMRHWIPLVIRKPISWVIGKAELLTAYLVDFSIATQPDVSTRLGNNCLTVENPPRFTKNLFEEVETLAYKIESQSCSFRLIYIGSISSTRGLNEMIDALQLINQKINCRLWLIGPDDNNEVESAKKRAGWKYTDYLPKMPQEEAFAYVSKSDVGLIYINNIGDHSKTDPNKIYEYMAFSKPFIASNFQKWRNKLDITNSGIFIDPGSSIKLAQAILLLYSFSYEKLSLMGNNGKEYVLSNNWNNEFVKILFIYNKLLSA